MVFRCLGIASGLSCSAYSQGMMGSVGGVGGGKPSFLTLSCNLLETGFCVFSPQVIMPLED